MNYVSLEPLHYARVEQTCLSMVLPQSVPYTPPNPNARVKKKLATTISKLVLGKI
jgi:hypothetical protein